MNKHTTKRFLLIIILLLVPFLTQKAGVVSAQTVDQDCYCEYYFCRSDEGGCINEDPNNPDLYWYKTFPSGSSLCKPDSFCTYRDCSDYTNCPPENYRCEDCPPPPWKETARYGDIHTEGVGASMCIESCSGTEDGPPSGDSGPSCVWPGTVPYSCDLDLSDQLQVRIRDASDSEGTIRVLAYKNRLTWSRDESFAPCNNWYKVTFTGYINIPPGDVELEFYTDSTTTDFIPDPGPGVIVTRRFGATGRCQPDKGLDEGQCCMSTPEGYMHCTSCANETGYPYPRCPADEYGPRVDLGVTSDGSVTGEININTGDANGLTTIITHAGTYSKNFKGGWYPIYADYVMPDNPPVSFMQLKWKLPGMSNFEIVPSSAFVPCGAVGEPPTGTLTYAGGAVRAGIDPVTFFDVYESGSSINLKGDAADVDGNLSSLGISHRPYDPVTGQVYGDYTSQGGASCSGNSCTYTTPVTIPDNYSVYYINAYDDKGNKCTGKPGGASGFSDCDPEPLDRDNYGVFGDVRPVCDGLTGPGEYTEASQKISYSTNARDNNGHAVKYDLDVTGDSGCSEGVGVGNIVVYAAGSQYNGVWPQMSVIVTDLLGNRFESSSQEVNNEPVEGSQPYYFLSPSPIITMVEVSFANDEWDRDLYVYGIDVKNTLNSEVLFHFDTAPASDPDGNLKVYYDTGTYPNDDSMDGISLDGATVYNAYYYGNDPKNVFDETNGYVKMAWNGLLRFPMMWLSPATTGLNCSLSMVPVVGLRGSDVFLDGNPCNAGAGSVAAGESAVTGTVYEVDDSGSCSSIDSIDGTDASVTMSYVGNPVDLTGFDTSLDANGNYNISPLFSGTEFDQLCIANSQLLGDESSELFVPECITFSASSNASYSCVFGGTACAINCSPPNELLNSDTVIINFGFSKYKNDKWFNVIDGDFFGPSVIAEIGESPADDFSQFLINKQDNTSSVESFGFSDGAIDYSPYGLGVSETSGDDKYAKSLGSSSHSFDDEWLKQFKFVAPEHDAVATGLPDVDGGPNKKINFNTVQNTIYVTDVSDFNEKIKTGDTYKFNGTNKVAVVYVLDDSGTITFSADSTAFFADAPDEKLVIVTNRPIVFEPDFGIKSDLSLLTVNSIASTFSATEEAGVVDLFIISSNTITFNSKYDQDNDIFDYPILVDGAVISADETSDGGVVLNRNLGYQNNTFYPSEIVRHYGKILYDLTKLERENDDIPGYTGLATFDVQWDYEDD